MRGETFARKEGERRWDPKRSYLFSLDRYWQIDGYQYAHDTDRMPCSCGAGSCRGVMNLSRREAEARRAAKRRRA